MCNGEITDTSEFKEDQKSFGQQVSELENILESFLKQHQKPDPDFFSIKKNPLTDSYELTINDSGLLLFFDSKDKVIEIIEIDGCKAGPFIEDGILTYSREHSAQSQEDKKIEEAINLIDFLSDSLKRTAYYHDQTDHSSIKEAIERINNPALTDYIIEMFNPELDYEESLQYLEELKASLKDDFKATITKRKENRTLNREVSFDEIVLRLNSIKSYLKLLMKESSRMNR